MLFVYFTADSVPSGILMHAYIPEISLIYFVNTPTTKTTSILSLLSKVLASQDGIRNLRNLHITIYCKAYNLHTFLVRKRVLYQTLILLFTNITQEN